MSHFKEFKVGDILNLYMPKSLLNNQIEKLTVLSDELYPLIMQTTLNNGLVGYVSLDKEYLTNKNSKTLLLGSTNSQSLNIWSTPFYAINAGNTYIVEHVNLNKYSAVYLKTALDKVILNKYSYMNKNSLFKMKEDLITLPVKLLTDTEPDWEYMEQYIKDIEKKAILKVKEQNEKDIALLKEIVGQEKGSDFTEDVEFKDFRLGSFFNSHLGYKVDKLLSSGSYKVISGVTENNGILGYVNDVGNSKIFTDTITISNRGENSGKAYYQKDDFILSNNAIALEKKLHVKNHLSKHVILYLTASINKLNYGGYGNYPTKAGILEDVLSLPVNKRVSEQVPDWNSIEEYMKHIQQKYIILKEQENEIEINNLLSVTGLTPELILSEEGQFA